MMSKQKLLLSVIGILAIAIPAVILVVLTQRTKSQPQVPTTNRSIDARGVEEVAKKYVAVEPSPQVSPSPSPIVNPVEGTPQAQ